jgi:DnaJ like chaperone protein
MRYGKWIGGALGWALGGPIGGILGFAFGTIFDDNTLSVEQQNRPERSSRRHQTAAGDFAASLLVLSAAIMKADGKILKSELNYVREFYEKQFGKELASQQMLILRDLLKKDIPLREVSEQIRYFMEHSARLQLIHYLFGIANADQNVDKSEVYTIERIAQYMGISEKDYASIKAMFYKDAGSAFKILEISESASDEEVKKAYRRMAKKYHPDKVRDLGEAHQKAAQEKFLKVQEAYDTIKKQRGFK